MKKNGHLCLQAALEAEVAAKGAAITSLEANLTSLTRTAEETSEELQTLQGAVESLEEGHKVTTARLETQLAALNMEKVRNGSLLSHCSVLLRSSNDWGIIEARRLVPV